MSTKMLRFQGAVRMMPPWSFATRSTKRTLTAGLTYVRLRPSIQRLKMQVAYRLNRKASTRRVASGSRGSVARAVWTIIAINAGVFAAWQYAEATNNGVLLRALSESAILSEDNLRAGRYYTLVSSAFSHREPMHFLFNMYGVHLFGGLIGMVPGIRGAHIFGLTLTSAVASSSAWLWHSRSTSPAKRGIFNNLLTGPQACSGALGASGVVMATSSLATCLVPFAPMQIMFLPGAIPLFVTTGLYAMADAFYINSGSRIGHAAHLGGFAFGIVYYLALLRKRGGIWELVTRRRV